jgi:hypothetical protein
VILTLDMTTAATQFAQDMQRFVQQVRANATTAVHAQMAATRAVLVSTSPVDTGALQGQWGAVQDDSSGDVIAASVENTAPYATILEYGGYRGVGPRTVQLGGGDLGAGFVAGGGIYSRQAPLGWVRRGLAQARAPYRQRLLQAVHTAWPYQVGATTELLPASTDLGALFGIDLVGGMAHAGLSSQTRAMAHDVLRGVATRRQSRGTQRTR